MRDARLTGTEHLARAASRAIPPSAEVFRDFRAIRRQRGRGTPFG
jgi:hypothetical protein